MVASGLSGALPAGNVAFVDANGVLTAYGRNLLNALINRTGGAPGSDIIADIAVVAGEAAAAQATATGAQTTATAALTGANNSLKKAQNLADLANLVTALANLQLVKQTGWAAPTGGLGSRAAVNTAFTTTVSVGYDQTEVQAIETQVEKLSKALGQLIIDLAAFKAIGP